MKRSLLFLANITAVTFSLSADDNFETATPIEFLASEATELVAGTNAGATAEESEPAHAGITATRSIWYAFTVDESRRVEILASPGTTSPLSSIVLAVYTGDELSELQEVSRYANFIMPATSRSRNPDSEPFTQHARLAFSAESGTTYYIAVDGENNAQGSFELSFSTSQDTLTPEFELVPVEAEWSYLQSLTGTAATDPATADPDFYTTWQTDANYDGPAFLGPRNGPFGYGTINGEPVRAFNLVTPATSQRNTATYFRTTVIPERGIQQLGFEGLIDDGAVIYINGSEVARMNMPTTANPIFSTLASGSTHIVEGVAQSNEGFIQYATASGLDLPAGEEIEIGVAVHNATATSSDMSFHMRIYATQATPLRPEVTLTTSSFADTYRLTWEGRKGLSYEVEFSETDLSPDSWETVGSEIETLEEDRTITSLVRNTLDRGFWRVRAIRTEEGE